MKIKVLGCHGSEVPGNKLCSFQINDVVILDAGSITATLTLSQQKKINSILITHSHLDHVKDICFLADNMLPGHDHAINVIGSREVIKAIKDHLLNGKLWPDFTKIPDPKFPILKYLPLLDEAKVSINGLEIKIVKVNHITPAAAYFISDQNSTVLFTGDMTSTPKLWRTAGQIKNLKAVFISTAFPNKLKEIADSSKHLTPEYLKNELAKLNQPAAIYSYHQKSQFENETQKEIRALLPRVAFVKDGATLTF